MVADNTVSNSRERYGSELGGGLNLDHIIVEVLYSTGTGVGVGYQSCRELGNWSGEWNSCQQLSRTSRIDRRPYEAKGKRREGGW